MIKLFEQYNEYSQVKSWLDKMGITKYTINDDLTVDVNGYVDISNSDLTEIPIQFGKIKEDFNCGYNELTSLKGCPREVGTYFYCNYNELTSLKGCPREVSRGFYCGNNQLTSLVDCPRSVGTGFYCSFNPLPKEILNFTDMKFFIVNQDDYGIWNSDGSFNKARWNIFLNDYKNNTLN